MRLVPRRIQSRTASVIAVAFFLFLSLFFLTTYLSIRGSLIARTDAEVRSELRDVAEHLRPGISSNEVSSLAAMHRRIGESALQYTIGEVQGSDTILLLSEIGHTDKKMRVIRLPTQFFFLAAAYNTLALDEAEESVIEVFAYYFAAGLLLAVIAGIVLSRYLIGPIGSLARSARDISMKTEASVRLPVSTTIAEVADLASSINALLEARERALEQQRHFAADAAHELRTPLTVLKGEMEVELRSTSDPAQSELLRSNLEEVDRLIATVQDLLELSEIESESNALPEVEHSSLLTTIRYASERLQPLAEARSVKIEIPLADLTLRAQERHMTRMIYNLLLNAIQHSEVGSSISVRTDHNGSNATLSIEDRGQGIPAEQIQNLFERFHRGPNRCNGGAGLGLAIVKSITDRYGFSLAVESVSGIGTTVSIQIPAKAIVR